MVSFSFGLFSKNVEFPIHIQYGFHNDDLYTHKHEDFTELVIVLDGSASHIVSGRSYPVSKGDVFVLGQDIEHGYENPNKLSICNIMIRPEAFDRLFDLRQIVGFQALFVLEPRYSSDVRFSSAMKLSAEGFREAETVINRMMFEYERKNAGWQAAVFSHFIQICLILSRRYKADNSVRSEYIQLADAVAYMEQHFTEEIAVSELAELSGYSERQFLRLFHAIFRSTPNNYLTNLRIRRAKLLLVQTSLSVTDIAAQCGYADRNYFARLFKKHTDMTPTEFRTIEKGKLEI